MHPEPAIATMLTLVAMWYVLSGQGGGCLCGGKLRHRDDCPLRKD